MKRLEQLLEQETLENRLEGFLVFYSCSSSPDFKPLDMPFGSISAYADSLNKQFGVPSPSVIPRTPSPLATAETFSPSGVLRSLEKPYISKINEEELAYSNSLSQQFNAPSLVIKPVTSHAPSPLTFEPKSIVDAVKYPSCTSYSFNPITSDNSFVVHSSPKEIEPLYEHSKFEAYKPFGFESPETAKKFRSIISYKGGISSKDEILDSKPYKYLDNFRKKEVKILTQGIHTKADFLGVLDMFKENKLPSIYEKIKQNLNMKLKSVTLLTLTNPLYTRSMEEEGPVFLDYDNGDKEIRLPITQPKFIPFIKADKQKYRDILLNSFLPHEQSHANINEKYGPLGDNEGLIGLNEHLANTMAYDSLGQNYTKSETDYQNMWAGNSEKESHMAVDYYGYLRSNRDKSKVPANIATVNMLGNQELKKKTGNILNSVLKKLYPDETFREEVSNSIYELSRIYQTKALKITELSKHNTILSNFKAKKLLSEVEKGTFKFAEGS